MKIIHGKTFIPAIMAVIFIGLLTLVTGCTKPPTAGLMVNKNPASTGDTLQFTDQSLGEVTSWLWDFGDGSTSTEPNPAYVYRAWGNYTVSLTAANDAGSHIATMPVTVLESPVASISTECPACLIGQEMKFSGISSGHIDSYLWNFGDGATSTEINPSHLYDTKGAYTVSLTVANALTSDTKTIEMKALEAPVADFTTLRNAFAYQEEIQFTDNSTGDIDSYLWDFGDGDTSTEPNPTHAYRRVGTYTISLTVANGAASQTKEKEIEIIIPVTANFRASPYKVIAGVPIDFRDDSLHSPDVWLWDFGDGNTSTERNPSHVYYQKGTYTVTLTVSNEGSSDTMVKEDYITVTTIEIYHIYMSNGPRSDGLHNMKFSAKFLVGERIYVYFAVHGFTQQQTSKGYEFWLETTDFIIVYPDQSRQSMVFSNPEFRETASELDPEASVLFNAEIGKATSRDQFGEYTIEITVTDRLTGETCTNSITFEINDHYDEDTSGLTFYVDDEGKLVIE